MSDLIIIETNTWYVPGSKRIGSLFGRWQRYADRMWEGPSRLHVSDECGALRGHFTLLIDIFQHPDTGQEYVIHPRTGTLFIAKYCKFCRRKESK